MRMQLVFDPLRTGTEELNILALAVRALRGYLLCIATVVTQHAAISSMMRQYDRTIRAQQALPASAAQHKTREAAPVQQQHSLLFREKPPLHLLQQAPRERILFLGLQKLYAHVDHFHFGQWTPGDSLGQPQQHVFARISIEAALDARRCRPENRYRALL